jgi:hypothetical protein
VINKFIAINKSSPFLFQNFGMGAAKIANVVNAMNEFGPASIGLLAFEWVHLIKSNLVKEKLTESSAYKIKVRHFHFLNS